MPSSDAMYACRRVCCSTPRRASMRMMATSGRRGAGRHVARVLLVARRVGDDELALVGGEVAVRDVDGDALLALGQQPVGEQSRSRSPPPAGYRLAESLAQGGELVVVDHVGVVEQAADERALAVVHGAARHEAQELLPLVQREVRVRRRRAASPRRRLTQKYPSRFFVSIDPFSSWSMSRPCRSELPRQQHLPDDLGQRRRAWTRSRR